MLFSLSRIKVNEKGESKGETVTELKDLKGVRSGIIGVIGNGMFLNSIMRNFIRA